MWYLPFTKSPRKHTVTYHFSDLQEVYSGNRQIHTKCQLQYFHPPHISTSGKCHCVIIHQTTKATEYIGVDVKVSAQVTTVTYMHQSQPSLHSLRKHLTVLLELWPGNHLIWCNATYNENTYFSKSVQLGIFMTVMILYTPVLFNSFIETAVSTVQPHILYTPWSKNVIQISVQMQCVIFDKQN